MNNISLWEILYPQKLRTNRIYKIMKITLTLVFVSIFSMFAGKINEKEEKMKADSITSPIRKQGFRASMTVKW